MPRLILTGGSGFLGRDLAAFFAQKGWEVTVISRHDPKNGARFVAWDGQNLGEWAREFEGADAVINLAGKSVNCRYNAENQREITASRVETTGLVARAIAAAQNPPLVWLNASSATFYPGNYGPPKVENDDGGDGFSVGVVRAWEAALFEPELPQTRRVALRIAMVFGARKGGVWDAFALLARLGFGGPMAGGKQYISWIHTYDFARAALWIIEHDDLSGPVNIVAPHPIPNAQFLSGVRRALKIPYALPTMRWQLEIGAFLGRTETELLLKSRRVAPAKLLESGFKFEFPVWDAAAREIAAQR